MPRDGLYLKAVASDPAEEDREPAIDPENKKDGTKREANEKHLLLVIILYATCASLPIRNILDSDPEVAAKTAHDCH